MCSPYLLVLIILIFCYSPGCLSLPSCRATELCVTEQICQLSDDSGRGLLGKRSFNRHCGTGLICCDKEQLESYYASLAEDQFGNPWATTTTTTAIPITTETILAKSGTIDSDNDDDFKSCGEDRLCVPRHLCSSGVVNEDGRYIIVPKIDSTSNFGCRYIETCCPIKEQVKKQRTILESNSNNFTYKGCGYSNPKGLYYDLVGFNDNESLFAQFPWMIALFNMEGKYICGGTLIHPQLVLTTAHNLGNYSSDSLLARAGDWDLNSQREQHPYQMRRISIIHIHENYNKLNFHNDMAFLVLEKPFQLSPHIQPICLPPVETTQVQEDLRQAQCIATGWGRTNTSATKPSEEHLLKRIELPVVEHGMCQRLLRRTVLGKRYRLDPSFICAGGVEGKDTCQGDGGSPLFCSMPGQQDRYHLAGLVSWGIACNTKDIPAAYTNVANLRQWIDTQADRRGFELPKP